MPKRNRAAAVTRYASVQAGIDTHVTGPTTLGGVAYTPTELKAIFAAASAAIAEAEARKQQWRDAVIAAHAAQATAEAALELLKNRVVSEHGKGAHAVLGDFGMDAPKPKGPQTLEAKARGVAKRAATRAVRFTMGAVQRQAYRGVVEVPLHVARTLVPIYPAGVVTLAAPPAAPALPEMGNAPVGGRPAGGVKGDGSQENSPVAPGA